MLTHPSIVLAALLATVYATVFHLLSGKTLRQFLVAWMAAVVGFAAGQAAASLLGDHSPTVGELRIVWVTLGSWAFMLLARKLSL